MHAGIPPTDARLARALRNARIAFFDYQPAAAGAPETEMWRWSGTQFGIAGLEGEAGRDCLIRAVVEADRDALRRLLSPDAALATRSGEFRLTAANGHTLYLHCDASAEPDLAGGGCIVFGTVRDVTTERQFEAELTSIVRRNHMLLATIDASPLSITVADTTQPDAPLIYVNRKFLDLTGYEAAEVLGRNCRFLQGPESDPQTIAAMRRAIAAGEAAEIELQNYCKNGSQFLNRLVLAPIHDDSGQLTAYIGMQADATLDARRKSAEAQRQKMEALGRMMGGVAHEINNLLQPVTLLAQHMIDEALIASEGRQHMDIVLDCSLKARHIIGDLLAFSRPTLRSTDSLDPVGLLEDSLRLVRQAIPPGIQVSVRIAGKPPPVRIDRTTFAQIMLNLATNAGAAMRGTGELRITLDEVVPRAADGPVNGAIDGGGQASRCIRLRVSDTGCGMDRTTLDRAFEPFFTTKPIGQGTGLGLPVVYGLIREAGGAISLDSEPGRGTTATILIPSSQGALGDGVNSGR
jgi:PAS domain S-box-containing protein